MAGVVVSLCVTVVPFGVTVWAAQGAASRTSPNAPAAAEVMRAMRRARREALSPPEVAAAVMGYLIGSNWGMVDSFPESSLVPVGGLSDPERHPALVMPRMRQAECQRKEIESTRV